jgi:glyoxylate carboligase
MKAAAVIAEILKREGVKFLIGYPNNPIIEAAASANIRTIIVRQERTGLHMAEAVSRVSAGQHIGTFTMQYGPGAENSFGGVAQAYGDSAPIMILPGGGYPRRLMYVPPNFNAAAVYGHIAKSVEQVGWWVIYRTRCAGRLAMSGTDRPARYSSSSQSTCSPKMWRSRLCTGLSSSRAQGPTRAP